MYDRSSLDNIMFKFLAGINLPQAITDDVMLVAYDYNSQQPRFYSKYFYAEDSLIYGVEVYEATGASSAAPTYFDPKFVLNGYGAEEVQIDGGVICNNPSLYAYQMAKYLNGKDKVRVVSLGTGTPAFVPITSEHDLSKTAYALRLSDFMMDMDIMTATEYLAEQFGRVYKRKDDYIRAQIVSAYGMDVVDAESIKGMVAEGDQMWEAHKEQLQSMVRTMLDEKYG